MPFGTPADVEDAVKVRVQTVGSGGGLLLEPTHVLEPEVPWDNIVALVEAVEKHGWYR
jgi:uroporphyrinogen decarboxylase